MSRHYRPDGYTDADERADLSFLVGANFGRDLAFAAIERQLSRFTTRGSESSPQWPWAALDEARKEASR